MLTGIPIIVFSSLKANLIFYGGGLLVFIFIVILSSQKEADHVGTQHNSNSKPNNNGEKTEHFQGANTIEVLTNILIKYYYDLEENINIRAYFIISANEIIEILGNKKVFIFNNSFNCTTSQSYFTDINVRVTYTQGFKVFRAVLVPRLLGKLNKQDIMVHDKINDIFDKIIKPKMSDFEKELAIHDFLILTSRYDEENYRNNTIPKVSYTPYGLLFKHKAVCSAYAEVFMIFMTLANIECYYVLGTVRNVNENSSNLRRSIGHAWNIVRIENQYYHVDVTFDNPIPDVIGKVNYNYFNVTDNIISRTHIWNKEDYPSCYSKEYNYYNYKSKSMG